MTVLTYTGDAEGHNGQSATLSASLADDEGNPIAGMELSFVLGSQGGSVLSGDDGAGATNVTLNQCPGAYTIESSFAGDDYYVTSTDSDPFQLLNSDPSADAGSDQSADEGDEVSLSATFTDVDTCQTHTATIDWGDGSAVEDGTVTEDDGSGTVAGSHTYADDGPYAVCVEVTDDASGTDRVCHQVTVDNVAPQLAVDEAAVTVNEGESAANSGTFSDPGDDVVEVTASMGTVSQVGTQNGAWSWSYASTDGPDQSQTVTVTATDSDGDSRETTFALVVNNVTPSVSADEASVAVDEGQTRPEHGHVLRPR